MTFTRHGAGIVTRSEAYLRKNLRKQNIKYEAQKEIKCKNGRTYIVDLLVEKRLVVEVNGIIHDTPQQQYQDKQRDKDLTESGYPVLRISNVDVWQNLKTVIKNIRKALKEKP